MILMSTLAALAALTASAEPSPGDGGSLAIKTPRGLAGVETLVGRSLADLKATPLVCAKPQADGETACRVARRYGAYRIDMPPPLTDKINLRRLTLHVRNDHVEAVSFETSPDNFHALVVLLKTRFGAAVRSRSASVKVASQVRPRLTMAWRAGGMAASLTDPTPFGTLAVRITAVDSSSAPPSAV